MSNPNHDAQGRFSSGSESGSHVEKSTYHASKAKEHAEKAIAHHAAAQRDGKHASHLKSAEHHAEKAAEHHASAKEHAEHASHTAHGAGEQVHAHVAHEGVNLTEMVVDAAKERVEELKENAEQAEV